MYKEGYHVLNKTRELNALILNSRKAGYGISKISYIDDDVTFMSNNLSLNYIISIENGNIIMFRLTEVNGINETSPLLDGITRFSVEETLDLKDVVYDSVEETLDLKDVVYDIEEETIDLKDVVYDIEEETLNLSEIDKLSNFDIYLDKPNNIKTIVIDRLEYVGRLPLEELKHIATKYETLIIKVLDKINVLHLNRYSDDYYLGNIVIEKSSLSYIEGTVPDKCKIIIENSFFYEREDIEFKNLVIVNNLEEVVQTSLDSFILGKKELIFTDEELKIDTVSNIREKLFGLQSGARYLKITKMNFVLRVKTPGRSYEIPYRLKMGNYINLKSILLNYLGMKLSIKRYHYESRVGVIESIENEKFKAICESYKDSPTKGTRTFLYPMIEALYYNGKQIYRDE